MSMIPQVWLYGANDMAEFDSADNGKIKQWVSWQIY